MKLLDLLESMPLSGRCFGDDVDVEGLQADSRHVQPGDLFIAIPGVAVDGHSFIDEAIENGAVAVIGELPRERLEVRTAADFSYVRVSNARQAWGWVCAVWEGLPSREMVLIGVTGTDGKTTTVTLIRAILGTAGIRSGMISTVGAVIPADESTSERETTLETGLHTTTPDPPEIQRHLARMVKGGATHAALEVTSHGLAQRRVAGCDFDVAVITNITHEHLDYHGSVASYQRAKARLFEDLCGSYRKPRVPKISVLNRDDDSFGYLRPLAADRHIAYSLGPDGEVTARDVAFESDSTRFLLHTPLGEAPVEIHLIGLYNVQNALAAASVAVGLGIPPETIAQGIASVRGVPGRMERIDEGQSFLAVVDFAHTPNALRQALTTARQMVSGVGRVIVIFGSAGLRDVQKRRLMGRTAGRLADVVILTAEDPRTEDLAAIIEESAVAAKAEGKCEGVDLFSIPDRGEAILQACEMAQAGDVVIACGKGHEQSMCFGETEYPWDDRRAMRLALRGKALRTLPTAEPKV